MQIKNLGKNFPLLLILALLIFSVGLYVGKNKAVNTNQPPAISAPTDETADWKTYADKKYGFSFKYPTEFSERVFADGSVTIYTKLPDPDSRPDKNSVFHTYVFEEDYDKYHLKITDPIGTKKRVDDVNYETIIEKLTIDTKQAIKIKKEISTGTQSEAENGINVIIDLNGKNFLSITNSDKASRLLETHNITFDQILSTFRFE